MLVLKRESIISLQRVHSALMETILLCSLRSSRKEERAIAELAERGVPERIEKTRNGIRGSDALITVVGDAW